MKNKILDFLRSKKGGGIVVIAGLVGIVLIYLSSVIPQKDTAPTETESVFLAEEYISGIEQQVRELTAAISGDTSAVVTVTLESGKTYVYAEDTKENNRTEESEKSVENEQKYIIVKDSEGAEHPLIVTEKMPTIRGVAIVCGPIGEETAEKLKAAVMAALDITSRKICIAQKAY